MQALLHFCTRTLLATVFCAATATTLMAQCVGSDLRPTLSEDQLARIGAAVDATPYPRGNHWLAERNGRSIHVIGTYHLDSPRFDAVADRLRPVVEEAEILFLEVTGAASDAFEAEMASDPSMFINMDGPTLPELLDEEVWVSLRAAIAERGVPVPVAAKMQPWFLSVLLSMPPCAITAMAENEGGLDTMLEEIALDAGVPVAGMETPAGVMGMVSGMDIDTQLALLTWSLGAQDGAEDVFATLEAAYFDEEHAFIWEFTKQMATGDGVMSDAQMAETSAEASRMLLDERNRAWIDVIEAAPQSRLTVAAGAAHLFGDNGVLALLEARGYTITRQSF